MNSSLSFVLKGALPVLLLTAICGCGAKDGLKELQDGRAAYEIRDFKKAERLLLKSHLYAPERVDTIVELTKTQIELGEIANAEKTIAKAEALAPEDADVVQLSAQIAWHLKKYDKAMSAYSSLANNTKNAPSVRAKGWTGIGIVNMTIGSHHLARIAFLKAIRIDRLNPSARYHLGLLYREAPFGYDEAALEQFEVYVRINSVASPRVQKTQRTLIPGLKEKIQMTMVNTPGANKRNSTIAAEAVRAAETAWKKGEYKTAQKKYQEAFSADVLSYPAALGLAKAIEKTDKTSAGQKKALDTYCKACKLRPSVVSTYVSTGDFAMRLNQPVLACEIYSRALAANPASGAALEGLIKALRKIGGKDKLVIANAYQSYRDMLPKNR